MDKSTLIIYCIFICINSAVLFFHLRNHRTLDENYGKENWRP